MVFRYRMGIVSRWQIDGESLEPFEPLNELVRTGTNRGHRTTEPVSAFKPPQLPRGPTGDTALHEDQPGTQHYTRTNRGHGTNRGHSTTRDGRGWLGP